jgi:hypothetical protein
MYLMDRSRKEAAFWKMESKVMLTRCQNFLVKYLHCLQRYEDPRLPTERLRNMNFRSKLQKGAQ